MKWQVNRLQAELMTAAHANASLEEARVQHNDHINELLNSEKMRTKQVTPELDAEMLGKKVALHHDLAEHTRRDFQTGTRSRMRALTSGIASKQEAETEYARRVQIQQKSLRWEERKHGFSIITHEGPLLWPTPSWDGQ